jgi:membrane protein implicated in regulation of membrane protease activity
MKLSYLIVVLIVLAWPLYYLYELQLGAISFLLLAILFLVVTIKEVKKLNAQKKKAEDQSKREKMK